MWNMNICQAAIARRWAGPGNMFPGRFASVGACAVGLVKAVAPLASTFVAALLTWP